jgi:repressor LexA
MAIILPKRKKQILEYLKNYITQQGYAPTLSEIAKKFRVSSLATVHEHVQFLEKNGFLQRRAHKAREMMIIHKEENVEIPEHTLEGAATLLPIVGTIAAGEPIEAIEDRDAVLSVPHEFIKSKNCYILKVKGDSMVESLIADGDYIIVEKRDYAQDGDIVVALLENGTATLKQFFKHRNYIRLQPANKNYEPILVENVIIQGKVVGIIRKFR